jgi:hypothetical protein
MQARPGRGRRSAARRRPQSRKRLVGTVSRAIGVAGGGAIVIGRARYQRFEGGACRARADGVGTGTVRNGGPILEPAVIRNPGRIGLTVVEVAEDSCRVFRGFGCPRCDVGGWYRCTGSGIQHEGGREQHHPKKTLHYLKDRSARTSLTRKPPLTARRTPLARAINNAERIARDSRARPRAQRQSPERVSLRATA